MLSIKISDATLVAAAKEGMDEFLSVIVEQIKKQAGGDLNGDNMQELNVSQITLWAYFMLREELMDGGFVQLIHNGYGPFFFNNPFAKIVKDWGLRDLAKIIFEARKLYFKHGETIEAECDDDAFMALFEQFPDFDDLDDAFVEGEESFTNMLAVYVDEHLEDFIEVEK